jgi:hypothetical protein
MTNLLHQEIIQYTMISREVSYIFAILYYYAGLDFWRSGVRINREHLGRMSYPISRDRYLR